MPRVPRGQDGEPRDPAEIRAEGDVVVYWLPVYLTERPVYLVIRCFPDGRTTAEPKRMKRSGQR